MTKPIPIICDMTDAPDTPQERLDAYNCLFDLGLESSERTGTGMRWQFRHSAEAEALARELARRENACCGFMTTTVSVVGEELRWNAATIDDPMAHAVLDLMRELPERIGAGVETLHERFVGGIGVPILREGTAVSRDDALAAGPESPAIPTE